MSAISPTISVVIPTYNRQDLLRVTLDALAQQTYPADRFEVVVVSDGSTDGTDEMVPEYAKSCPYTLRLVPQANAGPARARNRGIREATGDVVVFIDDDIETCPGFLAAHASCYQNGQNVAVVGHITPDPERQRSEPPWILWEHAMLAKNYVLWAAGGQPGPNHFYTGNVSARRKQLLEVGGFDESLKRQEDTELAYRLERDCGVRFVYEAGAVGIHRPERSFSSWLRIPYGYGQLDVVCARQGTVPWQRIIDYYQGFSLPTRFLACIALRWPAAARVVEGLLLVVARGCFTLQLSGMSLKVLSAIYNLRYLEGVSAEVGTARVMPLLQQGCTP